MEISQKGDNDLRAKRVIKYLQRVECFKKCIYDRHIRQYAQSADLVLLIGGKSNREYREKNTSIPMKRNHSMISIAFRLTRSEII